VGRVRLSAAVAACCPAEHWQCCYTASGSGSHAARAIPALFSHEIPVTTTSEGAARAVYCHRLGQ